MTIAIRPPRGGEWTACRMLHPRAFDGPTPPEVLLAWDEESSALAGGAAFHRLHRETGRLHVVTLRPFRRRGVGSLLLRRVIERAGERGDERVWGEADLTAHPEAEAFTAAHGFVRGPLQFQLEGELAPVHNTLRAFLGRLETGGKLPAGARIVDSSELPSESLARWYEATAVPALDGRAGLARYILASRDFERVVLLAGDRLAGFLAGVPNDGQGRCALLAVVVAPEFRGGWGWANLLLLNAALERASAAGAHRLRFETDETNWRVLGSAARVRSDVRRSFAVFTRCPVTEP